MILRLASCIQRPQLAFRLHTLLVVDISRIGAFTPIRRYATPQKPLAYDVPASAKTAATTIDPLNRANSTNLYQAFGNHSHIFGCYFIGFALIFAGVFNGSTIAKAHKSTTWRERRIPSFVPALTFISSIFLIAGGGFFWLRVCFTDLDAVRHMFTKGQSRNMVKSIRSIPVSGHTRSRQLTFEIERSSAVPFNVPNPIKVRPGDITLSRPLWMGAKDQVNRRLEKMRRKEKRANTYSLQHGGLMSLPLRQAAYWTGIGFTGIRRAFVSSSIVGLHIKGQRSIWKIDQQFAWSLDEGRAIDDLVHIKSRE